MGDDRLPPSELNSAFDQSRDQAAHEKERQAVFDQLQYEQKIKDGKINPDETPKFANEGRIGHAENTPEKKEERRRKDQAHISKVLIQMQERLAVLEQQMAERLIILQAKYGEDAIGGMAAEFLGDQAAGLRTEQERLEALAEHFLDESGSVKPEFSGSDEALYIRDWQEAQTLKSVVSKYVGKVSLSEPEIAEIQDVVASTSLSGNKAALSGSDNSPHQEHINDALNDDLSATEGVKTDSNFAFK